MGRYITSKWRKTVALVRNAALQRYVPETKPFRREVLRSMLAKWKMVYVKPDIGRFGGGVMKAERLDEGGATYRYQIGEELFVFHDFDAMCDHLMRRFKGRRYLVQQGIPLLQNKGRPFDIRVMVQQNLQGNWETTGIIGRIAQPGKVVTNYHSGGTLAPFERLFDGSYSAKERLRLRRHLETAGVRVARQLHRHFPGLKEIGIDVGVDQGLRPWILEVNTKPDPYIFHKLPDKRVFQRVKRYYKANAGIKP